MWWFLRLFHFSISQFNSLAGTLSLSRLSGSGRVWVVDDDNNPTGLKYFRLNTGIAQSHV